MNLFDFFRRQPKSSANVAKERLQILLAHERSDSGGPDYLPLLQKEILAVIRKYIPVDVDGDKVEVRLDRGSDVSTLEVNIELPGAKQLTKRQPPRNPRPAFAR